MSMRTDGTLPIGNETIHLKQYISQSGLQEAGEIGPMTPEQKQRESSRKKLQPGVDLSMASHFSVSGVMACGRDETES
jgi:hypothetical protein